MLLSSTKRSVGGFNSSSSSALPSRSAAVAIHRLSLGNYGRHNYIGHNYDVHNSMQSPRSHSPISASPIDSPRINSPASNLQFPFLPIKRVCFLSLFICFS